MNSDGANGANGVAGKIGALYRHGLKMHDNDDATDKTRVNRAGWLWLLALVLVFWLVAKWRRSLDANVTLSEHEPRVSWMENGRRYDYTWRNRGIDGPGWYTTDTLVKMPTGRDAMLQEPPLE